MSNSYKEYASKEYVEEAISSGPAKAIIDVDSLPTENINGNAFYRVKENAYTIVDGENNTFLTALGKMTTVVNVVDALPEQPTVFVNPTDLIMTGYLLKSDLELYGYADAYTSLLLSVTEGWHEVTEMFPNNTYIVTSSPDEATETGIMYVIYTKGGLFAYNGTEWVEYVTKAQLDEAVANAGSGGVSSWNDLTDKPFSYTTELREVIPEETCTVEEAYYYYNLEGEYYLEVGKDYILTVNGVEYPLTAYIDYNWGCIALGNLDVFDKEGGDENTFFIENYENGGSTYFYAVVPGDYTISVHAIDDIIQPINEKVIPDTIARKDSISWNNIKDKPFDELPVLDDILPMIGVKDLKDFSDSVSWTSLDNLPFSKPLVEGNEYTVYFNCRQYRLIAKPNSIPATLMSLNESVSLCIGNLALVDAGEPSSEPFLIVYNCRVIGEAYTQHSIELYVDNNYYTDSIGIAEDAIAAIPLDEKYLPYGEKRTILTWDGNTEGRTFVPLYPDDSSGMYKISDRIFTNDQIRGLKYMFSDGNTYGIHDGNWERMVKAGRVTDDIVEDSHGYIAIVRKAGAASNSYPDMVYPEVGVYVYAEHAYYWYVNYVDFGMVTTLVSVDASWNTLTDKPFGDNFPVKLTWDGNPKGLTCTIGSSQDLGNFKISGRVFTDEEIRNASYTGSWGGVYNIADDWDTMVNVGRVTEDIVYNSNGIYFVRKPGARSDYGEQFPEVGVYVRLYEDGAYICEINFSNATGQIDEKYIPDTVARVNDAPIVFSPNGTKYKITVDDSGKISATKVSITG